MALAKSDFLKCVRNEPQGLVDVNFHDLVSDTDNRNEFDGWAKLVKSEDFPDFSISSENGIARDSNYWLAIDQSKITKYNLSGNIVATNTNPFVGITPTMSHLGDGELYNGILYIGMSNFNGTGPSDKWCVAKYNLSDLSLIAYNDVTAYSGTSGMCLSLDKTEIYGVSYLSDPDKILRYDANTLAYKGYIPLSENINKMQGIVVAPDGFIHINSEDNPDNLVHNISFVRTVYPDGTVMPQQYRGWGMDDSMGNGKIEGACIWDGIFYTQIQNEQVRQFVRYPTLDDSWFGAAVNQVNPIKLIDSIQANGTILIRTKLLELRNYNNIFNTPLDSLSTWAGWVDVNGIVRFKIDSNSYAQSSVSLDLNEHILAFTWNKKLDGTVDIQVGVDGTFVASHNQQWQDLPTGGLYLHSKNTVNEPNSKCWDRGYAVLNKVISAQEFIDVNSDFDSIYNLFSGIVINIGQVSEANTAQSATNQKTKQINQATETDTTQPVTTEKLKSIGQVHEIDTANQLKKLKLKQIVKVSETDISFQLSSSNIINILNVIEINTSHSVNKTKTVALSQTYETDISNYITYNKLKEIGQAIENDVANPILTGATISIGKTFELNDALSLSKTKTKQIGKVTESDIANIVIIGISVPISIATEIDIAQSVSHDKIKTLLQAIEFDIAQSISSNSGKTIGYVQETNTAQSLSENKTKKINQSVETDIAQIILYPKTISVGAANELDIAFPITIVGVDIIFRDSIRYNAYITRKIISKTKIGKSMLKKVEL